jgi:Zn-dependent membrane protease YugP
MDMLTGLYIVSGFAIVPLVIYGLYARIKVSRLFEKYSKQPIKKGITGSHLARTMLNSAGLNDVVVEEISGTLRDHFDPRQNTVRLSRPVARNSSIASIGIAAHEASHAIQHGTGYPLAKLRSNIAPIVEKAGYFILPLLILGLMLSSMQLSSLFINVALLLFLGIVVFYLVTLPVELEASARALRFIKENNVADEKELEGVKKVLSAAALTYVIALALSIVQFLNLLGINRRR